MAQNISTLRAVLFDELTSLRAGKSQPQRAAAVANLSKQIIATAHVELRFHELRGRTTQTGTAIEMDFVESANVQRADAKSKQPEDTVEPALSRDQ